MIHIEYAICDIIAQSFEFNEDPGAGDVISWNDVGNS